MHTPSHWVCPTLSARTQDSTVWLESVGSWTPQKKKAERWSAVGRLADGGSPGRPRRAWLHRTAPEPRSRSSTYRGQRTGCSPGGGSRGLVLLPAASRAEAGGGAADLSVGAGPILDKHGWGVGFVVAKNRFSGRRTTRGLMQGLCEEVPGMGACQRGAAVIRGVSPPSSAGWHQVTGSGIVPRSPQGDRLGGPAPCRRTPYLRTWVVPKVHLGVRSCPSSST